MNAPKTEDQIAVEATAAAETEAMFTEANIPTDLMDDPEIMDDLRAAKIAKGDENNDDDNSAADGGNGGGAGDKPADPPPKADESGDKPDGDAADDSSGDEAKDADDSTFEFENDVAIGDVTFTKDELKDMPTGTLESISKLKQKIEDLTSQASTATGQNRQVLADPVIQERMRRIQEGKGNEPYLAALTSDTQNAVVKALGELDITPEEAETFYKDVLLKNVMEDVSAVVNGEISNRTMVQQQEQAVKEAKANGMKILLGMAEHNPSLKIDETNLDNLKPGHPEWQKFEGGIGKIQQKLIEKGITHWTQVSRFSSASLYAMAAAELGMPVAINTKERDSKIAQNERSKLIEAMGGKRIAKAMSSSRSTPAASGAAGAGGSLDNEGAIDDARLDDPEYVDSLFAGSMSDEDDFRIQEMVRARRNKKQ